MTGTMFDVKVDRDDPTLLHDQVAAQIRRAIADGETEPGERLPSARHLAAVMHVNTNTVLRALRLLRDEGLLELRPGHGIRVTSTPPQPGPPGAAAARGIGVARHAAARRPGRESDRARPARPRNRLHPHRATRHH